MANEIDLMNTLPPELYQQQQALNRQQQMASMLMQQNQQPQGQMVSGRYVAPSFFQNVAPLANMLTGAYLSKEGDKQALDLQTKRQQGEADALAKYLRLKNEGDVEGANLYGASQLYSPILRQMGTKQLTEPPKWEKSERTVNGMKETGYVNLNSPDPTSTFRLGGKSPDIETAKGIYEGYLPSPTGGQMPMGGQGGASSFGNAVNKVLGFEGGYVASDGKTNAPTNFGINQKANPDVDVKNLTKDQAVNIYKTRYWDAIGGDKLDPKTAEIAFDAAVNQGVDYAKGLIQKTGGDPSKMLQQRAQDYQALVQKDPSQSRYLSSWMNRLTSLSQNDGQNVQAPKAAGVDAKYMPSNLPQYEYNPQLSPKQNQIDAAKFNEENTKNAKNAKNAFGLLKSATDILNTNAPSSGLLQNAMYGAANMANIKTDAAAADQKLKVLSGALTMQQPRFEGPQGVLDVELYKQLAGDLGNSNITIPARLATIEQMKELAQKYYPNGDWGSIDTGGAVIRKNILGGTRGLGAETMTPQQFAEGLNAEDKEAFNWARKNPNDPRATKIIKKLGID